MAISGDEIDRLEAKIRQLADVYEAREREERPKAARAMVYEDYVDSVFERAKELALRKRGEYGTSNILRQGQVGVLDRLLNDKSARLRRYRNILAALDSVGWMRMNGIGDIAPAGALSGIELELFGKIDRVGVRDDAIDVINYLVILLALMDGMWTLSDGVGGRSEENEYDWVG